MPSAQSSPRPLERLAAAAIVAVAVIVGAAGITLAGAPRSFAIMNGGALCIAVLLAMVGRPHSIRAFPTFVAALAIVLLISTFLIGPEIDGVRRWITLGPVTLHAAMLVIPAFVAALMLLPARVTLPLAMIAACIAALQPDFATALALFLGIGFGLARREKGLTEYAAILVAAIAVILTALRGQSLAPVEFVETALGDAWRITPLMAGIMALVLLAAIVIPPLLVTRHTPAMRPAALAVIGAFAGYALAGLFGPYPQPLIGYGASPIIGWGLTLACLTLSRLRPA